MTLQELYDNLELFVDAIETGQATDDSTECKQLSVELIASLRDWQVRVNSQTDPR